MYSISVITNSFTISVQEQDDTPDHHHAFPVEVSSFFGRASENYSLSKMFPNISETRNE
jgi:hypothetical protein